MCHGIVEKQYHLSFVEGKVLDADAEMTTYSLFSHHACRPGSFASA
jgi:hypothetical protein